jgi:hypothetical protein
VLLSLVCISSVEAWELKVGTNLPPVDFHGFASEGFLKSDKYDYLGDSGSGTFKFTEVGLNASINPLPRTRIAAQMFLFDVGQFGKYEPFLDYGLLEYTFNDYLGLRGGRIRKPGGIYNHIQDLDLARTWVLLPQGIYDARWRDFSTSIDGGEVFGNFQLGKGGSVSYEAFAGYAQVGKDGGLGALLKNTLPPAPIGRLDQIYPALSAGSQIWWNTPLSGLRLGVLYQHVINFDYDFEVNAPFGPGKIKSRSWLPIQQYSAEYVWKNFTFQAEYYNIQVHTDNTTRFGTAHSVGGHSDSWYASAAYRFNKYIELGSYYGEYYSDTRNRDGSGLNPSSDAYQKDLALTVRLDPKDWWSFKVEGHYMRGTALLENNAANPSRNNDGWFMLAVKTTFSF